MKMQIKYYIKQKIVLTEGRTYLSRQVGKGSSKQADCFDKEIIEVNC